MTYPNVLLGLAQALLLLAVAPLFAGVSRVLRARMHNRRGPGVLQEYRDIAKLLKRQNVAPAASGLAFHAMPYLLTGTLLAIACALPMLTVASPLPGMSCCNKGWHWH